MYKIIFASYFFEFMQFLFQFYWMLCNIQQNICFFCIRL